MFDFEKLSKDILEESNRRIIEETKRRRASMGAKGRKIKIVSSVGLVKHGDKFTVGSIEFPSAEIRDKFFNKLNNR